MQVQRPLRPGGSPPYPGPWAHAVFLFACVVATTVAATIHPASVPQKVITHGITMMVWAPWAVLSLRRAAGGRPGGAAGAMIELAMLVVVVAGTELIQRWTPGHTPEMRGFYASLGGALAGWTILWVIMRRSAPSHG